MKRAPPAPPPPADFYAQLGVAHDASATEIKRAYRLLARQFHPDVSKEPLAEERFKEVAHAYEVLGDAEQRAQYDIDYDAELSLQAELVEQARSANAGFSGTRRRDHLWNDREGGSVGSEHSPFGAANPDSLDTDRLFESLFSRGAEHAKRPRAGANQHADLEITLQESYSGAQREISLALPVTAANGRQHMQKRHLHVQIARGLRAGQQLRLQGQGEPGLNGGPPGDLFLTIHFRPDPQFEVDGRDVLTPLPLAPWEAALGTELPLATPGGPVTLTVPAGASAGQRLRLKGRGLPGEPAGHLYAVLSVMLPPATSEAAKQAYQALAGACPEFAPRATPQR